MRPARGAESGGNEAPPRLSMAARARRACELGGMGGTTSSHARGRPAGRRSSRGAGRLEAPVVYAGQHRPREPEPLVRDSTVSAALAGVRYKHRGWDADEGRARGSNNTPPFSHGSTLSLRCCC